MRFEQLTERHLNQIIALWNKEWSELFPVQARLWEQNVYQDPNWLKEGSWVVIDEKLDQLIGFVVTKGYRDELSQFGIKEDMGWIQALGKGISSDFYSKLGYESWRRYAKYMKTIPGPSD